jgi:alkanesulfonate monooxygenase SsuD/methylene tetrahydromethanopterin reductase-like flavin-dependent oxidoreductase (luciferase family)
VAVERSGVIKLGFCLPQMGAYVDGESIAVVAKRAEELGYETLWVQQRLIRPLSPRAPYPVGDGTIPPQYSNVLDPIQTLTWAAAATSRIKLGTRVMVYA